MAAATSGTLPAGFELVAGWVPGAEAAELFTHLREVVPWEHKRVLVFGKEHPVPRLTCWFGPSAYSYSGSTNEAHPITSIPALEDLRQHLESFTGASFNSLLANYYRDGRDSMGWHSDDEVELGPSPTIASVSLGAARDFHLRPRGGGPVVRARLGGGDLLVMSGRSQMDWQHSLPKRAASEPRINLTYRLFDPRAPASEGLQLGAEAPAP